MEETEICEMKDTRELLSSHYENTSDKDSGIVFYNMDIW